MGYIQPVYVIPASAASQHLQPEIRMSLAQMQDWLAAHDGGRKLRLAHKVRFVRLREDRAALARLGVMAYAALDAELPKVDGVKYIAFADVSYSSCGSAAIGGDLAVVWSGSECTYADPELVALHEILHALGIQHVTDDQRDLMNGTDHFPSDPVLDPGHDHYWSYLMASPYLV